MKSILLSLALLLSAPIVAMDFPGVAEVTKEKGNQPQINPERGQPGHRCHPLPDQSRPIQSSFGSSPFERSAFLLRSSNDLDALPALNKLLEQATADYELDNLRSLMQNADQIAHTLKLASPLLLAWFKAPKAEHNFEKLEWHSTQLCVHTNAQDILLTKVNKEDFGQTQAFQRLHTMAITLFTATKNPIVKEEKSFEEFVLEKPEHPVNTFMRTLSPLHDLLQKIAAAKHGSPD